MAILGSDMAPLIFVILIQRCPTSPSTESIDSGILVSQSDPSPVDNSINFSEAVRNNNNNVDTNHNLTQEEQTLIDLTKDALAIYQK